MSRSRSVWPSAALVLAGALAGPARAPAAPQTSTQQTCVNELNKFALRVAKSQNRASLDCLGNAGRGATFRLGVPPQTQTAQACLTNDVGGRIARSTQQLEDRDARRCLASPEQLPGFGRAGATAAGAAARDAGLGMVAALFGPDLDAAVVPSDSDRDGARCQSEVLRRTTDLFYTLWKEALAAKSVPTQSAELTKLASLLVPVTEKVAESLLKLIDTLEDHDDVQKVYANFSMSDELMAKLSR